MMKAKAKYNVTYGGEWRRAGEVFHVDDGDAERMAEHVEFLEGPDEPVPEPELEEPVIVEPEETVRRGRKRKNAE